MKKIHQLLAFMTTAALLTCAQAGTSSGPVTNIFMHSPDVVMFKAGSTSGSPACSPYQEWAIKLSDPAGKGFLAILLSAQAQGKSVKVLGYTNTCRDWSDRELPSYIMILD
jgi:hypothetical protein